VNEIKFTAYVTPVPQGSMKGFVLPGKWGAKDRAILTTDNTKLKPYRGEVTREAMIALGKVGIAEPFAAKHVPVSIVFDFYLQKPASIPKKRKYPSVKPDLSKLVRSTEDAMTGILYADDAQVVEFSVRKHYGTPERVEVTATIIGDNFEFSTPQLSQELAPTLF
jgi:crossover junction endodeoxyribonuclease RusA